MTLLIRTGDSPSAEPLKDGRGKGEDGAAAVVSEPEESLMPRRGRAAALREEKLGKEPSGEAVKKEHTKRATLASALQVGLSPFQYPTSASPRFTRTPGK